MIAAMTAPLILSVLAIASVVCLADDAKPTAKVVPPYDFDAALRRDLEAIKAKFALRAAADAASERLQQSEEARQRAAMAAAAKAQFQAAARQQAELRRIAEELRLLREQQEKQTVIIRRP